MADFPTGNKDVNGGTGTSVWQRQAFAQSAYASPAPTQSSSSADTTPIASAASRFMRSTQTFQSTPTTVNVQSIFSKDSSLPYSSQVTNSSHLSDTRLGFASSQGRKSIQSTENSGMTHIAFNNHSRQKHSANHGFLTQRYTPSHASQSTGINEPFSGFEADVPIRISSSNRQGPDYIRIVHVGMHFATSSLEREVLYIQLTDPADPLFLYCTDIDQRDFLMLKQHQDIKVEFRAFPRDLSHLLFLCINETDASCPRFICELRTTENHDHSTLNVVETNTFKNLTHISLNVVPGDDTAIKAHLADGIRTLQGENAKLSTQCSDMAATIEKLQKSFAEAEQQFHDAQERLREEMRETSSRQLNDKEECIRDLQERLEHQRKENETSLVSEHERKMTHAQQQLSEAQSKVRKFEQTNANLLKTRYALEARVSELEVQLSRAQEKLDSAQSLSEKQRQSVEHAEAAQRNEHDRNISLQARMEELERQLKRQEDVSSQRGMEVEALQAKLQKTQQSLDDVQQHANALTRTLESCHNEIYRGNSIISKYQKDIISLQARLDERDKVVVQQEERIIQLQTKCSRHSEDVESLQKEYEKLVSRCREQVDELSSLKATNDSQQQELKAKERIISCLSKREQELESHNRFQKTMSGNGKRTPLGDVNPNNAFIFKTKDSSMTKPGYNQHSQTTEISEGFHGPNRVPQFRPTKGNPTHTTRIPEPQPLPVKPSTDYSILLS